MESWSYIPDGKGLWFPDEIDLPVDAFARSRKPLMEWDIRSPCNFENHELVSDGEAVESMEIVELGFPDMMRKPFHSNSNVGFLGEIGMESNKRVVTPTRLIRSNFSSSKEEFRSTLLSPILESNSQESSLIDLKLGRLAESKDTQNDNFLKENSILSSAGSPVLGKRARMMNSYSQIPFCQVQGCNKDLSTSKEYHKRHKVCDAHSKTPKVIVNGIEKRFCQQCSRFHLLAEFDDGKRSCRKRLAGHNERRRKPQLDTLSGKPHKLLQSYQGTRFLGTSLTKITPFLFPDILPGSILYPEKYEQANRHQKLKEESIYSPQMAIRVANGQFLPKSFLHLHGVGEQYSSVIPSLGIVDTATTVQDIPGVTSSSCALSLLSAQSQDSSSHSAETPTARPRIIQGSSATHCMGHIFDKPLGVSSLEKYTPNGFHSSDMSSKEIDKTGLMLSDVGHAADFEVQREGKFQGFLNARHSLSPEYGSTVDLFQLSSHLQRVERQRNFMQVKHENEDFFCFQTS